MQSPDLNAFLLKQPVRRGLLAAGFLLMLCGFALFVVQWFTSVTGAPITFFGVNWLDQPSVKTCARFAVAGCLLAAVGSRKPPKQEQGRKQHFSNLSNHGPGVQ